jgi:hypothetical protein
MGVKLFYSVETRYSVSIDETPENPIIPHTHLDLSLFNTFFFTGKGGEECQNVHRKGKVEEARFGVVSPKMESLMVNPERQRKIRKRTKIRKGSS